MTRYRLHQDTVAIGLSVVGIALGGWLLVKSAWEFACAGIDKAWPAVTK